MNKLKLELECLRVESFETASVSEERGTVRGRDASRLADSCGCTASPRPSDGCTIGCGTGPAACTTQNNPGTVIEY